VDTDLHLIERFPASRLYGQLSISLRANTHYRHLDPETVCKPPSSPELKLMTVPLDFQLRRKYYEAQILAQYIFLQHINAQYPHEPISADNHPLICQVLQKDLGRVNVWCALGAWLRIDGGQYEEHWRVPEDLSYGLVLQYPEPVIAFAATFLNRKFRNGIRGAIAPEVVTKIQCVAEKYCEITDSLRKR
jgi:hypothetical protein